MSVPHSDKSYWTHGYVLISKEAGDCVPAFLKHIAHDVYVCGKTINLLKLCCPRVSEGPPCSPLRLSLPCLSELRSRPVIPVPGDLAVCPYLLVSKLELGPW